MATCAFDLLIIRSTANSAFLHRSHSWSESSPSINISLPNKREIFGSSIACYTAVIARDGRTSSALQLNAHNLFNVSEEGAKQYGDDEVMQESSVLVDNAFELQQVIGTSHGEWGPDTVDRVDRLYGRARLLQQTAEMVLKNGGRVPAQIITTLKALQRERCSLENILRLATEANRRLSDADLPPPTGPKSKQGIVFHSNETEGTKNSALKNEMPIPANFQLAEDGVVEEPPEYAMTTSGSQGSSLLAAFGPEFERLVMEEKWQLQDAPNENVVRCVLKEFYNESMKEGKEGKTEKSLFTMDPLLRAAEADRKVRLANTDAALKSLELERLKMQLVGTQATIRDLGQNSTMADSTEAQVQGTEIEAVKNLPLEVHKQRVMSLREPLLEANRKVSQTSGELREKEAKLVSMRTELLFEQNHLLGKVRELTGELSKRVTVEEMEASINNAIAQTEKDLMKAQEKALTLSVELEKKERLNARLQEEWNIEKEGLQSELAIVKSRMANMVKERMHEKAQLFEAQKKVKMLEEELAKANEFVNDTEMQRELQKKALLDSVRTLIAQMKLIHTKTSSGANSTFPGLAIPGDKNQEVEVINEGDVTGERFSTVDVGGAATATDQDLLPGEKSSLEAFFAIMGQVIRQASEKMDRNLTNTHWQTDDKHLGA
eukprot:c23314_g1_i2 orf=91-2079(+)